MIFAMTPQLSMQLQHVLKNTTTRAEAKAIYLCDRGGNIVAQFAGTEDDPNADTISALAAGAFFAVQELARQIGEDGFHCVFHQGGNLSVYMQSMSMDMLMLVVFGKESNPGLIRLYASQACKAVDKLFAQSDPSGSVGSAAGFGLEFQIDEKAQPFSRSS